MARRDDTAALFPGVPDAPAARHAGAAGLTLRPFGLDEGDLEVDFRLVRPQLVTRILECCIGGARESVEPEFFWKLTVGKRTECLLLVLAASTSKNFVFTFRCPVETCGKSLEVEVSVDELAALQDEAETVERIVVSLGTESIHLRRPTGADQLNWLRRQFADERAAAREMLAALVLEDAGVARTDALTDEWLNAAEHALDEHEPLVNFSLVAECPECGAENQFEVDLEEYALDGLRRSQMHLLSVVHRLATRYHWSEQQIFSVPFWRRAHYLGLIEKEQER